MAFVVEQYILQRKEKRIEITLHTLMGDATTSVFYANDIQLLSQAYVIAAYWFKEQGL